MLTRVEDDDDDEVGTRKHVLVEQFVPIFLYTFIFTDEYTGPSGHLALSGPLTSISSEKYILQSALRI